MPSQLLRLQQRTCVECVSLELGGFRTLWEGSSRLAECSNGYLGISAGVGLPLWRWLSSSGF